MSTTKTFLTKKPCVLFWSVPRSESFNGYRKKKYHCQGGFRLWTSYRPHLQLLCFPYPCFRGWGCSIVCSGGKRGSVGEGGLLPVQFSGGGGLLGCRAIFVGLWDDTTRFQLHLVGFRGNFFRSRAFDNICAIWTCFGVRTWLGCAVSNRFCRSWFGGVCRRSWGSLAHRCWSDGCLGLWTWTGCRFWISWTQTSLRFWTWTGCRLWISWAQTSFGFWARGWTKFRISWFGRIQLFFLGLIGGFLGLGGGAGFGFRYWTGLNFSSWLGLSSGRRTRFGFRGNRDACSLRIWDLIGGVSVGVQWESRVKANARITGF